MLINSGLLCLLAYLACEVDVLSAIKVFGKETCINLCRGIGGGGEELSYLVPKGIL